MSGLDEMVELWGGCLRIGHKQGGVETEKVINERELQSFLSADSLIEYMIERCQREMRWRYPHYGDDSMPILHRWWAIYCSKELGIMEWRMARDRAGGYAHPSGLPSVEIACFYRAAKSAEEMIVSSRRRFHSTPTLSPLTEGPPSS